MCRTRLMSKFTKETTRPCSRQCFVDQVVNTTRVQNMYCNYMTLMVNTTWVQNMYYNYTNPSNIFGPCWMQPVSNFVPQMTRLVYLYTLFPCVCHNDVEKIVKRLSYDVKNLENWIVYYYIREKNIIQ